jgi:hypothetical protein
MDAVEKVVLVLPHLPARPFLVEKRDGCGRRYIELRYRIPKSGPRDRKAGIYLGRLSPLQRLAIRQAIDEARTHRNSATQLLRRIYARKRNYRRRKALLSVLAERAGYRLHGYRLRRRAMIARDNAATIQPMVTTGAGQGANQEIPLDPVEILRRGLKALRLYGDEILEKSASDIELYVKQHCDGKWSAVDNRVWASMEALRKHHCFVTASVLLLGSFADGPDDE